MYVSERIKSILRKPITFQVIRFFKIRIYTIVFHLRINDAIENAFAYWYVIVVIAAKKRREPTRSADADRFVTIPAITDVARDAGISKTRIPIAKTPADVAVIKGEEALVDYGVLRDADADALADVIKKRKVPDDLGALGKISADINVDELAEVTSFYKISSEYISNS